MRPVISGWGRRTPANTCTSTAPKKTRDPGPTGNTGSSTLSTPKSTSPGYRSSLNERKRLGLADFPAEILCSIAAFSAPTDRIALSQTARHISASIEQERRAALIIIHAALVDTLDRFKSLLASVKGLPRSLQAAPLTALCARISALPDDQQSAIQAFLNFLEKVNPPSTADLDALKEAAIKGPRSIQRTVHELAKRCMRNAESVRDVAAQFCIRNIFEILHLEFISIENRPATRVDLNVDPRSGFITANYLGRSSPERLEHVAIEPLAASPAPNAMEEGSAGLAVVSGRPIAAAAEQYGIGSTEGKRRLENIWSRAKACRRKWFPLSRNAGLKITRMKQRAKGLFTPN